ncbi:MAG: AmmeMemoRadiSam system protein A [Candidatus Magasanikbacteria bacterium]|nr:AmmeMemoRadiSam system protein A [Candidatus Magasanikbacteria bacterium]
MLTPQQQSYLLSLARCTLERHFGSGQTMGDDVEEKLKEKRGTFVTLKKNEELRGCIGHIEPVQEVYKDVIDNALAAAFEDTRFLPLKADELSEIKIEISVLTQPRELKYSSVDDLLAKLTPLRDGVIVRKGYRGATYLPQVWEGMKDKEEFLSSLCQKAGLSPAEWRSGNLLVFTYQAEVFGETQNTKHN